MHGQGRVARARGKNAESIWRREEARTIDRSTDEELLHHGDDAKAVALHLPTSLLLLLRFRARAIVRCLQPLAKTGCVAEHRGRDR